MVLRLRTLGAGAAVALSLRERERERERASERERERARARASVCERDRELRQRTLGAGASGARAVRGPSLHPHSLSFRNITNSISLLVLCLCAAEREFFIDDLLVRVHFIMVMIRWTGLAPWPSSHIHFHFGTQLMQYRGTSPIRKRPPP